MLIDQQIEDLISVVCHWPPSIIRAWSIKAHHKQSC